MVLLLIFVMDPLLVFSIHLVEYLTSMCIRFLDTALDISDDTLDISDDTVCGRAGRADLKFQNFLYPMESSSGIISLYRSR